MFTDSEEKMKMWMGALVSENEAPSNASAEQKERIKRLQKNKEVILEAINHERGNRERMITMQDFFVELGSIL